MPTAAEQEYLNTRRDDWREDCGGDIGKRGYRQCFRRMREYENRAVVQIATDAETARTVTLDNLPIFCGERRDVQVLGLSARGYVTGIGRLHSGALRADVIEDGSGDKERGIGADDDAPKHRDREAAQHFAAEQE